MSYGYRVSDDLMVYAKVSTGYRAGGFNGRGSPDEGVAPFVYDPEELIEYEVGFKGDFFDSRLRWNTAIYTNETKDKQFTVVIPNPDPGVPPGTANKNAGAAETTGFETELTYILSEDWAVSANYAYIDSKITELSNYNPLTGQIEKVSAEFIPEQFNVPENEWTLSLNYDHEFELFKVGATATYHWIEGYSMATTAPAELYRELEEGPLVDGIATTNPLGYDLGYYEDMTKAVRTDDYGILNLNITVSPLDDRYSVSLWSKNLLDERARNFSITNFGTAYQYVSSMYTEPRTWGVTFKATF